MILLAVVTVYTLTLHAQVKIGGAAVNPHASAILELDGGTTRGFLLPRMTTVNMNAIAAPAEGLMIYNTTDQSAYLRTNNAWVKLGSGGTGFTLPYSGTVNAPVAAAFSITNTGNKGTAIYGKAATGSSGAAGIYGDATILGSYGVKGVGFDGSGGFFSSRNKYALITDSGSVGLGTKAPAGFVEINGYKSSQSTLLLTDEDPIIQFRNPGFIGGMTNKGFAQLSGDDFKVGTNFENTEGKFIIRTGGLDQIFVNNAGRMGIGTDTASGKLQINAVNSNDVALILNDEAPTIQFRNINIDKGFLQAAGDDLKIGLNFSNPSGKFIIRTGGLDHVFVDNNGNMSIGTSQPANGYKLSINGKVIAEEMRIQNSNAWPDYVFAPAYKMMSLEEVKKYIERHSHLPGIPEAKTIEKDGIPVGEMQSLMMEKIEELTLHLIQANEQIKKLQDAMMKMQQKN